MNYTVKMFLSTLIPNNLPKKKKELLYSELECHLYDKADFYKEIGYSEDESIKKAIDDMGTDEEINNGIVREFEELYHERTWWAIIPAFIILLMNLISLFSGNWIISGAWIVELEYNYDISSLFISLISFFMIFVSIGLTAFGRIKKYRKWLLGAGIGNLILVIFFLGCFYPQTAMCSLLYSTILLVDKLTPFVSEPLMEIELSYYMSIAFAFLSAIYCFIASARIKYGKAKDTKNAKKKCIIFSSCFAAVAVISCCLFPKAIDFENEYPIWFDRYHICISAESQELYDSIELGMSYSEANSFLKNRGWISAEEYEKQLDKNTLKKFRYELKSLNFDSDYTVWFNPEKYIDGNGFVFLKQDSSGKIYSKGIGDASPLEFKKNEEGFTDYDPERKDDMGAVISDFDKLKKGDSEETVMSKFGEKQGIIYTSFESIENSKKKDYFRVFTRGIVDHTDNREYSAKGIRYFEFEFIDGKLTNGKMQWQELNGNTLVPQKKEIKNS